MCCVHLFCKSNTNFAYIFLSWTRFTQRFYFFCWNLYLHTAKHYFLKELVNSGGETLQGIKKLTERLQERDENIERISIWLQGYLEELRFLMEQELKTDLHSK